MELMSARREIKTLSRLFTICSRWKKTRDDRGYWNQLESFITSHSEVSFSHSICPESIRELYGDEKWFMDRENEVDRVHED